MWSDSQKYNCFVCSVFTEAILAFLDASAFFTDNENYPKVPAYPCTAATSQVQSSSNFSKVFCSIIRIIQDLPDSFPDAFTQTRITCKVTDELVFIKPLIFIHSILPRGCGTSAFPFFSVQKY